jgi:hypothetical protein
MMGIKLTAFHSGMLIAAFLSDVATCCMVCLEAASLV